MRLFLNPANRAYLREMATEFGASPGQLRQELSHLVQADIVQSERAGRQVYYRANPRHVLFPELNSMVRKALGMEGILASIVRRLGDLERAAVIDDYAEGRDTGIIDLVLLGDIDRANLADLAAKTEKHIGRRIRTLIVESSEAEQFDALLAGRPHLVIWDRESIAT